MIVYVDTSTLLRHVFDEGPRERFWGDGGEPHTSELTRIEAMRVIHRRRLLGELSDGELGQAVSVLDDLLANVWTVTLTRAVLAKAAEPFPTHVKTLDALHLASALLLKHQKTAQDVETRLAFFTHDRQQATAARALRFDVVGVSV